MASALRHWLSSHRLRCLAPAGEAVEGDVPDDFDDELRCEFGGGVVELRRELDSHLPGMLDDAWPDLLAQVAEGLAQALRSVAISEVCRYSSLYTEPGSTQGDTTMAGTR